MKKFAALFLVLTLALSLCACGKSNSVKGVEALIKEIGEINFESEEQINTAQKAYDALTEEDKEKVGNLKKLTKAKEEFENLNYVNDTTKSILEAATTTFSGSGHKISEYIAQYETLKDAYKDLTRAQKKLIEGYDDLQDAIEKLKEYTKIAQEASVSYVKAFLNMEGNENVTVTKVGCIQQTREGAHYHLFALIYNDANGKQHCVYSTARYENTNAYATMTARPDVFFSETPVSEESNPLINGNVEIDAAAAVEAARS